MTTPSRGFDSRSEPVERDSFLPSLRLLVIDDDLIFRTVIAKVAGKIGFTATEAASYGEAERLLQSNVYDCITLDLSLGRNYGIEVVQLLGRIGCKSPIIVVSGAGQSVAGLAIGVGRMLKLNMFEPIPKPVNFELLQSLLSQVRQQRAARGVLDPR